MNESLNTWTRLSPEEVLRTTLKRVELDLLYQKMSEMSA